MNNKRLFEFIDCLSVISFFIIFFRKAGATGAGIFAAAIFFYYILYVIFIEGVGNTMAKMVAVRVRRGFKENARKVFGYVMLYTFFMGALILFVFISASDSISQALFKDPTAGAVICFVGMLFFVHGFSHNIKYYYIGCGGHSLQTIADIVRDIILPPPKYLVDLRGANARRLQQLGLGPNQIDISEECTFCSHEKYWSHRYTKGRRGGQCAIIVLPKSGESK